MGFPIPPSALAQPALSGSVLFAHGILAGWIRQPKYWSCFAVRSAVRVIGLRSSGFPCEPLAVSNAKFAEKCCIPGVATTTTPVGPRSKGDCSRAQRHLKLLRFEGERADHDECRIMSPGDMALILADVGCWPFADVRAATNDVRCWGQSRPDAAAGRLRLLTLAV